MQSSGKHTQRCKTHKKPKRTTLEDRQAMWSRWGGRVDHKIHMESCISHQSSSRSSSGTWTEPPSRSAVRCDPRVSLVVTGVGWDSLPLGSGDLTQRANKGVWRQMGRKWWKTGRGGVEDAGEVKGQRWIWWRKEWKRQQGRGGEWMKKKETKNYRRHLPSRSRLVKTNYVNKGVKGSKNYEAQINTLLKSCRRKRKQPRLSR